MDDLEYAREKIRQADETIAAAFVERMNAVKTVAAYKKAHGLPVFDEAQEERVIKRGEALVADPDLRASYGRLVRTLMALSKNYQHTLLEGARIAYSGVEGAFAHIAASRIFPDACAVPFPSFEQAYRATVDGDCDCAVLPIENSYAGEVGNVIDLMFTGPLFVNGVYELLVTQNLLGLPGAAISEITHALSHPQALGQCGNYLTSHGIIPVEAANTAVAAKTVAEKGDPHTAAIASAQTAKLYGLAVLDHDINESSVNTTRFAVFSRALDDARPVHGDSTFILLFTVKNIPGALAEAIAVIGAHGFNMKALRSRPMKDLAWQYYFYVEAEGDDRDGRGKAMLDSLAGVCDRLKIVGRYGKETLLKE